MVEKYKDPKTNKIVFTIDDEGKIEKDKEWSDSKKKEEEEDESRTNKTEDK